MFWGTIRWTNGWMDGWMNGWHDAAAAAYASEAQGKGLRTSQEEEKSTIRSSRQVLPLVRAHSSISASPTHEWCFVSASREALPVYRDETSKHQQAKYPLLFRPWLKEAACLKTSTCSTSREVY